MDLIQIQTPKYLTGYAESRIGGRAENQDSFGFTETPFGFLITVCDGMGGGPGGKTASSIAVSEIINGINEGNKEEELSNILIKAIRRANLAILSKGNEVPELKGMGSTCTVLLINEDKAILAHAGDSRIYQLRGKNKIFRTFDHSMVFDLVKQKVITEEQARLSAQSNIITRALGIKADIEVDICVRPYLSGDRFILCTDGIHGSISEQELISFASDKKHSLGAITDEIATTVDGKGRTEGGGHDNLTLAIIETNINSNLKEKMNRKNKIILIGLFAICAISILLNIISYTHKPLTDKELTQAIIEKDSIIESQKTIHKQYRDSLNIKEDSIHALKNMVGSKDKKIESLEKQINKVRDNNADNSEKRTKNKK